MHDAGYTNLITSGDVGLKIHMRDGSKIIATVRYHDFRPGVDKSFGLCTPSYNRFIQGDAPEVILGDRVTIQTQGVIADINLAEFETILGKSIFGGFDDLYDDVLIYAERMYESSLDETLNWKIGG